MVFRYDKWCLRQKEGANVRVVIVYSCHEKVTQLDDWKQSTLIVLNPISKIVKYHC